MAARDTSSQHPVGRRSPPSGLIAVLNFLQRNNVVGSWTRVLQVAVLVCAPLLTVLVFGAVVVTALFYLKLDPVRWLEVGASATTVVTTASIWARVRGWRAKPPPTVHDSDVPGQSRD